MNQDNHIVNATLFNLGSFNEFQKKILVEHLGNHNVKNSSKRKLQLTHMNGFLVNCKRIESCKCS